MNQISLAQTGFELSIKRTRKREFLDEMNLVIPWAEVLGLLRRHAPESRMGRPPFALETMLRIHLFSPKTPQNLRFDAAGFHDVEFRRHRLRRGGICRLPLEC